MRILADALPGSKSFVAGLGLPARATTGILRWLALFVGHLGKMTATAVAQDLRTQPRHPAQSGRFLGRRFWQRVEVLAAAHRLLLALESCFGTFVFIVDQTYCGQQGQQTENTFSTANYRPRPKKRTRRQAKYARRSCHGFVAGLLLTPGGARLPFLRPYDTRDYCTRRGVPYRKQTELAADLIRTLPLPDTAEVVVVGDTAFDAAVIRTACAARQYTWIVPSNPERVLAGPQGQRPKLWSLASTLDAGALTAIPVSPRQGSFVRQRRTALCRQGPTTRTRTYYVHTERRQVHSVGAVRLVFSTTQVPPTGQAPVFEKLLLTNAVDRPVREVVELYTLRWQIELFFKEVKSVLGMHHYRFREFAAVATWVTLAFLAFAYLEWQRQRRLRRRTLSAAERRWWTAQRTAGLCRRLRREADGAELDWLRKGLQTPHGVRRLRRLLAAPQAKAA
jgi:hypothetical protein